MDNLYTSVINLEGEGILIKYKLTNKITNITKENKIK